MAAGSHRFGRAPPPTPIATGKGSRSAAVEGGVLADYLDTLRVPVLALPGSSKSLPADIDLRSLIAGDEGSVRRAVAAAAVVGAFRIDGGDALPADEVRAAIVSGGEVFRIPAERKRELGGCYRRREGIGEEFCWDRRMRSETDRILGEALPATYHTFRENLDKVAIKLEEAALSIQQILSKHQRDESDPARVHQMRSMLRLNKYDTQRNVGDRNELPRPHALSLHISGGNHEFCVRSPVGSASFSMHSGSVLVTVGEQLQEYFNGSGFEGGVVEVLPDSIDGVDSLLSLELLLWSIAPSHKAIDSVKTITIIDQLLLVIAFALVYKFYVFFKISI